LSPSSSIRRLARSALVLVAVAPAPVVAAATAQELPEDFVRAVRCPDGGIQPKLQVDGSGRVHLVYFKGAVESGDLFYASAPPGASGAEDFGAAVRINSVEGSVDARDGLRGAALALGSVQDGPPRVHVVWVGSEAAPERGPGGETPLLYARMDDTGAFETERSLIGGRYGLAAVPGVAADFQGNVHVFWHAPTDDDNPRRRIWKASSTDAGEAFSEPVAIDSDLGVSEQAGLTAIARGDSVVVLYNMYKKRQRARDARLLWSDDRGGTFETQYVSGLSLAREPNSTACLWWGRPYLLAAWEADGEVFWAGIDKTSHKIALPVKPRESKMYRRRPVVAGNARKVAVLAWMEAPNHRKPSERLGWQAFTFESRVSLGMGRVADAPSDTFPAVFLRPDQGFTILY